MRADKHSKECLRKIGILRNSIDRIYSLMDFGTENLDRNMISDFCLQISYASKSLKWISDFFPSLGKFYPDGDSYFRQLCISSWNFGKDIVSNPEKANIPELNFFISTLLPGIDIIVDRFTDERIREIEGVIYNVKEASRFINSFISQMIAAKNIISENEDILDEKYQCIKKYIAKTPDQESVSVSFFLLDHAMRIAGESLISLSRVAPPVVDGIRIRDAKSVKLYRHLSSHLDLRLNMKEALSRFPNFLEVEKILKMVLERYPRLEYASDMDREPFKMELTFEDEKKDVLDADIQEGSEDCLGHGSENRSPGASRGAGQRDSGNVRP